MGDKRSTDTTRSRTTFSREYFADYHTTLLADIRTDDICNDVYTGARPHPLVELQKLNQSQIIAYKVSLVAEEVLRTRPFVPAEAFIHAIKIAALAAKTDPPLAKYWAEFLKSWAYLRQQGRLLIRRGRRCVRFLT